MPAKNDQQIISHNEKAWNRQVEIGCRWTVPIDGELIEKSRTQIPEVFLTSGKAVPSSWIEKTKGAKVLLLAGGGGQQSALLAAYGADVTVLDLADGQLAKDREVAQKYSLNIKTVQGSADDLTRFEDAVFDYVINPVSNCFFPKLDTVWKEVHRVLVAGGELQYGFVNPLSYIFDFEKANQGVYQVKYALPYSDLESLSEEEQKKYLSNDEPLEFGHSFDQQIGELLKVGFQVNGFFEDRDPALYESAKYFCSYFNIRALKV